MYRTRRITTKTDKHKLLPYSANNGHTFCSQLEPRYDLQAGTKDIYVKWTPAGAVILRDTECCAQQHQNIANQFCNFLNRLDEIPLLWDAFTLWSWFESCRRTLSQMRKVCIQSTGTIASATHALNFVAGAHSPSANEICFGRMSAQESWMDMLLPQNMFLCFPGLQPRKDTTVTKWTFSISFWSYG